MPVSEITAYTCDGCGYRTEIESTGNRDIDDLKLHIRHGWVTVGSVTFCPDCMPARMRPDPDRHVYRTVSDWPGTRRLEQPETYDPWYPMIHPRLCRLCNHHHVEHEDDGSPWELCMDHNLYEGHYYGGPARGRLCPYWNNPLMPIGRDADADRDAGVYENPYDELYDGD